MLLCFKARSHLHAVNDEKLLVHWCICVRPWSKVFNLYNNANNVLYRTETVNKKLFMLFRYNYLKLGYPYLGYYQARKVFTHKKASN